MRRSHRIAATAVATTGLAAAGGWVVVAAGTPQTEVLTEDVAAAAPSLQLQDLQDSLAELQAQTTALRSDLEAARRQLDAADKARAAAVAAAQRAAAAAPAAPPGAAAAPRAHTRTGASGAGAEHEAEQGDD